MYSETLIGLNQVQHPADAQGQNKIGLTLICSILLCPDAINWMLDSVSFNK